MPNSNCENENVNGSLPTAAESIDQPEVCLYQVSVSGEAHLMGVVEVYATDEAEAAANVQAKIDDGSLDDDLEMEDYESGNLIPYRDVKGFLEFQICNVAAE